MEEMRLLLALVLSATIGCAPADVVVVVTRDAPDAEAPDADGGDDDPCRCAFHWTRGPEVAVCYTRGTCTPYDECALTLPIVGDEPSCHFL